MCRGYIFMMMRNRLGVEEGLRQGLDRSGVMMMMRVVAGNCGLATPDLTHTRYRLYTLTPHTHIYHIYHI